MNWKGTRQIDRALGPLIERAYHRLTIPTASSFHQICGQVERLLDSDAAVAEVALRLFEQLVRRRIVQIDIVAIRKHKLDSAERVEASRFLIDPVMEVIGGDSRPVDGIGIDSLRGPARPVDQLHARDLEGGRTGREFV